MSLDDWRRNSWLVEHRSSREEIAGLLAVVERDLVNARVSGLSPDWRFSIAYNAVLQAATAALAASGFRAAREQHHYRTVQSLAHTIGWGADLVGRLDRMRKKRNIAGYETADVVSAHEADEAHELARRLRTDVRRWLESRHPELLK